MYTNHNFLSLYSLYTCTLVDNSYYLASGFEFEFDVLSQTERKSGFGRKERVIRKIILVKQHDNL